MTIDPAAATWIIGANESGSASLGSVFWHVLVIFLLVFLNGFFVASEFALVKVRGSQLEALEGENEKRVGLTRHIISNLDGYLSATQLGITLASLGLGWIGEPYVAHLLEPLLSRIGIDHGPALHGISFTLGFAAIT